MKPSDPFVETIWEDSGLIALGRILGGDGSAITSTSVSRITRHVFDLDSTAPATAASTWSTTSPSTGDIHASLKTDSRWSKDATGYNFRNVIPHSCFPLGDRRYRVEYAFVPASTACPRFKAVGKVTTKPVLGS